MVCKLNGLYEKTSSKTKPSKINKYNIRTVQHLHLSKKRVISFPHLKTYY